MQEISIQPTGHLNAEAEETVSFNGVVAVATRLLILSFNYIGGHSEDGGRN